MIPFNKPYLTGKEMQYIEDAVKSGKISGNGLFTKKCQEFFEKEFGFKKTLLTTSCTDALEMAAILADIKVGDEVIVPSFTFVSTALAFVRQGADIVFADSYSDNPNIDADQIEALITQKTKAIVVVHYAGVACDMDKIMSIANKYGIIVIAFSFHETKNIISGEGGMLCINDDHFIQRAEIIWEKGTNRSQFFRGEVDKYSWVDTGSSFLPSEIISAFLWAQIENMGDIQNKRIKIWNRYYEGLSSFEPVSIKKPKLPLVPEYATNNAHMFYLVCDNVDDRTKFIQHLKDKGILSVFHYLSLHKSSYYEKYSTRKSELPNSDMFSDCLVRLPLFYELTDEQVEYIINTIKEL